MKKLLTILFLLITLGVTAQINDFLGVPKTIMLQEIRTNKIFSNITIEADTVTGTYNVVTGFSIVFRNDKVFRQAFVYDGKMSNAIATYLNNNFVVIETFKKYIDFNVNPPTYYNLSFDDGICLLLLHE